VLANQRLQSSQRPLWIIRSSSRNREIPLKRRRKYFFFEKKKQKTFGRFGFGLSEKAQPSIAKVFCFFFSKKKTFLPLTVSGAAICA
jgi:hypothetical protein